MVERKKDSEIKVNDRRLFTADGELRTETMEEVAIPAVEAATPAPTAPAAAAPAPGEPVVSDVPPLPSASEQKAQHDAYQQSARELDARVEQSGHSSKELQVSFERFMASLYMTAMMQLGLMVEQGGSPHVDIIGARQTIDTLSMLGDKTKGNLSPKEQAFMENALYELRMAYVEVTNALAHPPSPITGTNG
jgi:uncharacterized protein DUF1844